MIEIRAKSRRKLKAWFVITRGDNIGLDTMANTRGESISKYMEMMNKTIWGEQKWQHWIKKRAAKCIKLEMRFYSCK